MKKIISTSACIICTSSMFTSWTSGIGKWHFVQFQIVKYNLRSIFEISWWADSRTGVCIWWLISKHYWRNKILCTILVMPTSWTVWTVGDGHCSKILVRWGEESESDAKKRRKKLAYNMSSSKLTIYSLKKDLAQLVLAKICSKTERKPDEKKRF